MAPGHSPFIFTMCSPQTLTSSAVWVGSASAPRCSEPDEGDDNDGHGGGDEDIAVVDGLLVVEDIADVEVLLVVLGVVDVEVLLVVDNIADVDVLLGILDVMDGEVRLQRPGKEPPLCVRRPSPDDYSSCSSTLARTSHCDFDR